MNKVKYLLTYRYAEIIHDLTVEFTKAYLLGHLSKLRNLSNLKGKADYRQADQMNQAARSGKQNIVEGVGQSQTSKSGEIKLLGVSKASFEELLSCCFISVLRCYLSVDLGKAFGKDTPQIVIRGSL